MEGKVSILNLINFEFPNSQYSNTQFLIIVLIERRGEGKETKACKLHIINMLFEKS
jgi:hypothetical protein